MKSTPPQYRIMIGIPCYQNAPSETLEDYMRFAFYIGRRTRHEYLIAIKAKTEQFRARNSIVEGAIQTGCDFLLFLDDDHVIDWENRSGPAERYGFIDALIKHMEDDPKIGIVGVVYYHRGNECRPVLMKEGKDGGFYYMRDDELRGELQEVGVQGGGCFLLRLKALDKIQAPWFEPEIDSGTDVQICRKVKEAGYKVCCDTSIHIGHVMNSRMVIHPNNRHQMAVDSARRVADGHNGLKSEWMLNSALTLYRMDAEEYLGMSMDAMGPLAWNYDPSMILDHKDDIVGYYGSRGKEQLARQVLFHHMPHCITEMEMFHGMINTNTDGYGADVGCGSAPVTFELALRGHKLDFIDVPGAGAYEFTKWRAKKRGILDRCGWDWKGPYDYIFMLDSIEHIEDWRGMLDKVEAHLKENGALITNYFFNQDYTNPEHISMDKNAVKEHLIKLGIYPSNQYIWVKNKNLGHMDHPKEAAA